MICRFFLNAAALMAANGDTNTMRFSSTEGNGIRSSGNWCNNENFSFSR